MNDITKKLESSGYIDIYPLDKLAYTDGLTYSSEPGKYFTCRKKTDPEKSIFNSKLKKLGRTCSDRVKLQIKECTATSSAYTETSVWCIVRAKKYTQKGVQVFDMRGVRAAMHAASEGIVLAENCGIFPIFKYAIPSTDDANHDTKMKKTDHIVRYAVERKVDRDTIIKAKEMETKSLTEERETMKYEPTESERNEDGLTEAQRKIILNNYTVRNTDGEIHNKQSGRIITSNVPMLSGTDIDGTTIQMKIRRHRAYMWTFKSHERRIHQTQVDHIDGNKSNNVPWNYRWVSSAENCLAKHAEMKERVVQDDAKLTALHGEPSDPVEWKEGGLTLHSNMWIIRHDKSRFIKIAEAGTYPRIGVTINDSNGTMKSRLIRCHMAVTYNFLARIPISKGALANLQSAGESASYFSEYTSSYSKFAADLKKFKLYIMHADNDSRNYSVDNLEIGTPSENQISRHNNPETTLRKHVNLFEIFDNGKISKVPRTFESYTKAAACLERTRVAVSDAARFNRTCDVKNRRITTHKTTNVKYHVVECDLM
jgi:hypothetical protein